MQGGAERKHEKFDSYISPLISLKGPSAKLITEGESSRDLKSLKLFEKSQLVSLHLEPEYLALGVANEYVGSCFSNCDGGDFDTGSVPQNDRI